MRPEKIFDECLDGTVHRDTQVDAHGVHVTVAEVLTMHSHGSLDFGGSEMKKAAVHLLETTEGRPGDPYKWWRLEQGDYLIRFNESLKEGSPPMLLVGSERLVGCGCQLAPVMLTGGEIVSVLRVPKVGVRIKENARIGLLLG